MALRGRFIKPRLECDGPGVRDGQGGVLPGFPRPYRGRNDHPVGQEPMARHIVADLARILPPALVERAVMVASARRCALGFGVAQDHQAAHGVLSISDIG